MQVCKCCVRARASDTAVLVVVQRRGPDFLRGPKINTPSPLRPSAQTLATGAEEKKEEMRDTSMEDLAQPRRFRRPGGGEGAPQDAAESVADLSDFFGQILARNLDGGAARVDGCASHGGDERGLEVGDESVLRRDRLRDLGVHLHLWDLGEMGRVSFSSPPRQPSPPSPPSSAAAFAAKLRARGEAGGTYADSPCGGWGARASRR